ncbi:MAG: ASPIC/UnbV domain-containing protein [Planctomycetes bacterium]|nr:ASPIC/UnbV domain-containing protein [Planctomycetota bacterium]
MRAGGRRWTALVTMSQSYLCSSDPRAHFSLGSASSVEAVEVLWPDGVKESFPGRKSDQIVILKKGEGRKE